MWQLGDEVVLVIGAAGEAEFGQAFDQWRDKWVAACERVNFELTTIEASDKRGKETLQQKLKQLDRENDSPFWLVLIGHGTWDGVSARFNLTGPDVSAKEIATWLRPLKRQIVIVNCSSSSAPFIDRLSAANRVVVTATKEWQ